MTDPKKKDVGEWEDVPAPATRSSAKRSDWEDVPSNAGDENIRRAQPVSSDPATKNSGLEILYQEFPKQQQELNDAIASKDPDRIERAKASINGLVREIKRQKDGVAPTVNEEGIPSTVDALSKQSWSVTNPANGASGPGAGSRFDVDPLTERLILGGAGAITGYGAGLTKPAAFNAARAVYNLANTKQQPDIPQRVEPGLTATNAANTANTAEASGATQGGKGVAGWLAGRTTPDTLVPETLVSNVATLKGQGPASASFAEAQNAANVEKTIAMGEPPTKWAPEPGGKVLVRKTPSTTTPRTFEPAPLKEQAAESGTPKIGSKEVPKIGGKNAKPALSDWELLWSKGQQLASSTDKNARAVGNAMMQKAFELWRSGLPYLSSFPAKTGAMGLGVGLSAPDWLKQFQEGDPEGALKTAGTAAGTGLALTFAPAKAISPINAAFQGSDAYSRFKNNDMLGGALSTVGAVAPYLAPLAMGTGVGIPVGFGLSLAAPVMNKIKDNYLTPSGATPNATTP